MEYLDHPLTLAGLAGLALLGLYRLWLESRASRAGRVARLLYRHAVLIAAVMTAVGLVLDYFATSDRAWAERVIELEVKICDKEHADRLDPGGAGDLADYCRNRVQEAIQQEAYDLALHYWLATFAFELKAGREKELAQTYILFAQLSLGRGEQRNARFGFLMARELLDGLSNEKAVEKIDEFLARLEPVEQPTPGNDW